MSPGILEIATEKDDEEEDYLEISIVSGYEISQDSSFFFQCKLLRSKL